MNAPEPRCRYLAAGSSLRPASVLSVVAALTAAGACLVGLVFRPRIYPTEALVLAFGPTDGFTLAVGLPVLLCSMLLAWRGSLIGLLSWPGALFYLLYAYIPYLLGVPFGVLFLPYLVLVATSASALAAVVAAIDGHALRERLSRLVPVRTGGGILAGLALLIVARQTVLILVALLRRQLPDPLEVAVWIADFAVGVPIVLASGVAAWRRSPPGYASCPGMLLGYGLLVLSLLPNLAVQARHGSRPVDLVGIVVLLGMAALCFVPFALFVRGLRVATSRPQA